MFRWRLLCGLLRRKAWWCLFLIGGRRCVSSNPVEARTFAEVTNRVRTLKAIRKARGLTQQQISDQLRISQGEVSRIERRGNLHLSTLVRFIEATGGKLRITAIFDDQEMEVAVGDLLHAEPA